MKNYLPASRFISRRSAIALLTSISSVITFRSYAANHETPVTDTAPAPHMPQPDMSGMASKTGNVDYDFALNMRRHHQLGLEMAQYQVENGKDAEMVGMAQEIIHAQKQEITRIDEWLMDFEKNNKKTPPE